MLKKQKKTNTGRLNSMLLSNQWSTEDIKEEIKKKYLEANDNENIMIQNLWDAVKAVSKREV